MTLLLLAVLFSILQPSIAVILGLHACAHNSINLTNETEQRFLSSALILHMPSELIKVLVNVLRLADDAAVNIAKFVGNSNEYGRIARLGDEFRRKR